VIVVVQANATAIDQAAADATSSTFIASIASVIIYSALIEVMPLVCPLLSRACKWDNPRSTRAHKVIGYYFGRVTGLLVYGVSEFGMLIEWASRQAAGGAPSDSSRPLGGFLHTIARLPDAALFTCGQDQLASKFLQQALIGFALPKIFELSSALGHWVLLTRIRRKPYIKRSFLVEKKFIRNVYFQGLLWIAVPYAPFMAFLMPLFLLVEFRYDKAYLLLLCNKNTTPFQGDFSSFLIFHTTTMFVFVCGWAYLFLSESSPTAVCGPFWSAATSSSTSALDFLSAHIRSTAPDAVDFVTTQFVSNAYLLWIVLITLLYYAIDRGNRGAVLQDFVEERTAMDTLERAKLQARAARLEKQVERLKSAATAGVDESAPWKVTALDQ